MSALLTRARQASEPEWTQQRRDLWTGRCGGVPVGTIERGRRFTFVDVDGMPGRRHRSLQAAQQAWRSETVAEHRPSLVRPFAAGASMAAASIGALLVLTGPHLR